MALNLAKRPFVDTRPVNALTSVLVLVVLVLSVVSVRTFRTYLSGSHGTLTAIAELRGEIARDENERRVAEAALARYDVGELGASVEDANDIARRRSFSWTRFLTRLEETLPHDERVVAIALAKETREQVGATAPRAGRNAGGMLLNLTLISRDPLGMPKTIRAFYGSPYFDRPVPVRDESPEKGSPEGRRIGLTVLYLDAGRTGMPPPAKASAPPASAAVRKPARPAGKGSAR